VYKLSDDGEIVICATAPGVTVTTAVADFVSHVATICAVPSARAVTVPEPSTVAMFEFSEFHAIVRFGSAPPPES
jgi:hypothetical protein